MAFGNNTFVSVGGAANGSGYIATIGADGTVTRRVSGVNANLNSARFLNGAFYVPAVNAPNNTILRSANGDVYSTITFAGLGVDTKDIAFGNGVYVGVGTGGRFTSSTDGLSFANAALTGATTQQLNGIDFANGVFVAVGNAGTIITSPNGTTWTLRVSGTSSEIRSVMFSQRDQLWYAAGNGGVLLYSPDAITWTSVQNSGTASVFSTTLQATQQLPQFKSGTNKIALSYTANSVQAALNGVTTPIDTTATIPTITAASIAENLNGYINKVEIFPTSLTTAELTAKTL